MNTYTSKMQTYYFKVMHPVTGDLKIVRHPAVNLELARKVLVIKCGEVILDRIVEVRVGDKVVA
jgi:hypothetical protein